MCRRSGSSKRRIKTLIIIIIIIKVSRRSGSSKRRIKTANAFSVPMEIELVGEVVPAREGLRRVIPPARASDSILSEKWFQQEKD